MSEETKTRKRGLYFEIPLWVIAPVLTASLFRLLPDDWPPEIGGALLLSGWAIFIWCWVSDRDRSRNGSS